MKTNQNAMEKRFGAIIPLMAILLAGIIGFLALAVDIGNLAYAKNQAQSIADAAAFAGARTLNGNTLADNNRGQVRAAINSVVSKMLVLDKELSSTEILETVGSYSYNKVNKKFSLSFSKSPGNSWSAVKVEIKEKPVSTSFAKAFNVSSVNVSATATAAFQPRDIAMVLDYSDSMRTQSFSGGGNVSPTSRRSRLLGFPNNTTNPGYPNFGCWEIQEDYMLCPDWVTPSNITQAVGDNPPLVNDFFSTATSPAFKEFLSPDGLPYTKAKYLTGAYGDIWPKRFDQDARANTARQVVATSDSNVTDSYNNTAFRTNGYDGSVNINGRSIRFGGFTQPFKGYTIGPNYYGKTFYIWPPDPRTDKDWRRLYFDVANNAFLYYPDGNKKPAVENGVINFTPNYTQILNWIKYKGPNPFPPNLYAGRITYYDRIPDTIPATGALDLDQLFWKEYIDYVLGNKIYPKFGHFENDKVGTQETLFGWSKDPWGSIKITPRRLDLPVANRPASDGYMNYSDNPLHPRLHFWFGPLTMVTFLSDYFLGRNWLPGTCHETTTWHLKQCVKGVLDDIEENHPNDHMTLVFFSSLDRYNTPKKELGRNFEYMRNSLFYPSSVIDSSSGLLIPGKYVRPYEARSDRLLRDKTEDMDRGCDIPNSQGFTCVDMGLKVAFNQLCSRHDLGYEGRAGARKIVIFESDGAPTRSCIVNTGDFYNGRFIETYLKSDNFNETRAKNQDDAARVIDYFKNSTDHNTSKKPIQIHSLGFGAASERTANGAFLQRIQAVGTTNPGPLPPRKFIDREESTATKVIKLRNIVSDIMQSSVLLSLLE